MKKETIIENVRQIAFSMLHILFGFQSVGFIVSNKPEEFGKFGAIIIVWAVLNISISKYRYSSVISAWDTNLLAKQDNYQEYCAKVRDEALTVSFNLHASVIAQICHSLGRKNPFVENTKEAIENLISEVEDKIKNESEFIDKQIKASEDLKSYKQLYVSETKRFKSWHDLLMKIEVILLSWGTIQNAYGPDFVTWLHSLDKL